MHELARSIPNRRPARLRRSGFARAGRFVVALFLAFGLGRTAEAGVDRWTPYGPGEGPLETLVASTRSELYLTSFFAVGEIWQRPNVNALWRWRGAGLGKPLLPGITALAIHPKNPNALWAVATSSASAFSQTIFRSTDAGASWHQLSGGTNELPIVRLTVAPTAHSAVLLGETGYGATRPVMRSTDLGVTWTEVAGIVGPVAAAPDEPGTIYAVAASGSGLVKSGDGGATFHSTGALTIEAGDEVRALHATYGRPALVLVSLRLGGLYRSTNGGGTWRRAGFVRSGPSALASEPGDPRKIYLTNSLGLYASDRGGQIGSFRTLAAFFPLAVIPEPVALAAASGGPYFLAGNDLYLFTSPNGYAPVAKTGIEAFGLAELRISPVDPSFVALRRYTGCIHDSCDFRTLLSTDGGATFSRVGAQLSPRSFVDAADLAFDPSDPRRRLTAIGGIIVLGEPDGTGRQVYSGLIGTVEIAAGGVLLLGGLDGIHRSDDGGASWIQTLDPVLPPSPGHPTGSRQVVNLEADPYSPEKLIAGVLEFTTGLPRDPGAPAIYRSTDAGITWTKLRDGGGDVEFVPETAAGVYLLVSTETGTELRRSDDFGTTSTLIHTFPISDGVGDVAADPGGSGDLFAATRQGIQESLDDGATWEATQGGFIPFGPYRRWIGQVQVALDGRLIASPIDGGLFEIRLSN